MLKLAKEIFMIVPAFSGYYLITEHFACVSQAEGTSMQPTLEDGQLLLVQKTKFTPRIGDIIIAHSPVKPSITVCKRIKHLQNEMDPYGNKVPVNHVWIEGDNAAVSFDSRQHGAIPINLIYGRVLMI